MSARRATVIRCDGCGFPVIVDDSSVPEARATAVELFGWTSNPEAGDLCPKCCGDDPFHDGTAE